MMLKDLVLKNRSYRGFDESVRISRETLEGFAVSYTHLTLPTTERV